jgi:CheY-like chemotaxis protein
MSQLRIFVSHTGQDKAFCDALVSALRGAGADVWYDEHSLGTGHLLDVINRELVSRQVFIVVLSKAAFASRWVTQECQWAYALYSREPNRVILPVTAQPIEPSDFNQWLFLESFKRIEGAGGTPLPQSEAIAKLLHTLVLTPVQAASANNSSSLPRRHDGYSVLWVDDQPSNNVFERRTLEGLGIAFTISLGTDDALGKLIQYHYDAIISDMSRPPDNEAGYRLLEHTRKLSIRTPFIIYAGLATAAFVEDAKRRGAYGEADAPSELIRLVKDALGID